jgi:hypothetical protein
VGEAMTGNQMMVLLIGAYIVIALKFLHEGNYAKVWYWLAAAQITGSVLVMK